MTDTQSIETSEAEARPYMAAGVAQDPRVILLVGDEPEDPATVLRAALERLHSACQAMDCETEGAPADEAEYQAAMADAEAALAVY